MLYKNGVWTKYAPATFQRAVGAILASVKGKYVFLNIDKTIIFLKLPKQHPSDTDDVLRLLMEAGMTLKLKKCIFVCKSVEYLGHVAAPANCK